ncbi:hypothetical protein U8V97_24535, partial [Priestia filamentosa]
LISFFISFVSPSFASTLSFIWTGLLIWFITVFIHELGHLFFGQLVSLRLSFLTAGSLTLYKRDDKLKFSENKQETPPEYRGSFFIQNLKVEKY